MKRSFIFAGSSVLLASSPPAWLGAAIAMRSSLPKRRTGRLSRMDSFKASFSHNTY